MGVPKRWEVQGEERGEVGNGGTEERVQGKGKSKERGKVKVKGK